MITQLVDKYRNLANLWIQHSPDAPDCLPIPVQPTELLKLANVIEELVSENAKLKISLAHTSWVKAQEEHNALRARHETAVRLLNMIFDEVDSGSDVWAGTEFMATEVGPFLNRKLYWQKEQS